VLWSATLATRARRPRRALDLAMGRGRHVAVLAAAGFDVFGVDIRADAVSDAVRRAAARGVTVHGWTADLTRTPLPRERFDLILVTRYLQRDLFPAIRTALTPDGVVIYETFTEAQRALGWGPASPDHLLKRGELLSHFAGFEVMFYEEIDQPEAVARIVARKRT
jgi:tellurite methyltransferase